MTLLEHLKKRGEKRGEHLGKVATLLRLLPAAFPEFTRADADRVRHLPDPRLDELTDAIAQRRSWDQIQPLIQGDEV